MSARKAKPKAAKSRSRRLSLRAAVILTVALAVWGIVGEWYVHHPGEWLREQEKRYPKVILDAIALLGNPLADLTDGLGWTGHDAVYEYDCEAPDGSVIFAGLPRRVGAPAPDDIKVLKRGEFIIGWSDSLRHPAWVAYHVSRTETCAPSRLSNFTMDKSVPLAPRPDAYKKSGYDRGHLAPNYAMVTRYGKEAQRETFRMSNIVPQSPALNRGVWREIEHRIADLWTARYGEIWVVVGGISPHPGSHRIAKANVDIPTHFYQVIIAQEGMNIRALAVVYPQNVSWDAWPSRYITTIDEVERLSGLDFNPELPSFISTPLEAEQPTRLWPVRTVDILRQFIIRYNY